MLDVYANGRCHSLGGRETLEIMTIKKYAILYGVAFFMPFPYISLLFLTEMPFPYPKVRAKVRPKRPPPLH